MTNFKQQIKDQLKSKGLSVPCLARMVDLHAQTIYNYLKGRSDISAGSLERILAALKAYNVSTKAEKSAKI